MSQINQLDEATINKIAAGEVVERPAQVVKELIENSIDAGASAITVEIKEGGISFIRVTDNGKGIEEEDIDRAFLRHSTSKIKNIDDLYCVTSLGFRGEALSSIAAVSHVEMITKTPESIMGCRYITEGGIKQLSEHIGAPSGTTIIVRNLFYNTPVRRKFLKTPVTEGGYIKETVEKAAVSHPDISIRFIMNGQLKLSTTGNGRLKDVIYAVYGRDITMNISEIEYSCENYSITGFIGKTNVLRGNRNLETFYVNGRLVRNKLLSAAVEEGYKPYIMPGRYPFCCIELKIDPAYIDVNIHPSKLEIKFMFGQQIYDGICESVRNTLTKKPPIIEIKKEDVKTETETDDTKIKQYQPVIKTLEKEQDPDHNNGAEKKQYKFNAEPFEKKRFSTEVLENTALYASSDKKQNEVKPVQKDLFDDLGTEDIRKKSFNIVGQIFKTYWIVEYEDKMYMIDQHAAHEKVIYEKLVRSFDNKKMYSQKLLVPVIVTLDHRQEEALNENKELLESMGFEIENFGDNEYNLYAIPENIPGNIQSEYFLEFLDALSKEGLKDKPLVLLERLATMSCKAAVKGGNSMSVTECLKLIDELMQLDNPFNCPHGRPVIVSMTKYELEKKFKRIV